MNAIIGLLNPKKAPFHDKIQVHDFDSLDECCVRFHSNPPLKFYSENSITKSPASYDRLTGD